MRNARGGSGRTRREAAEWFTRLSRRSVTTRSIQDFRAWRRDPENRAAYEQVEAFWREAGALAEDPEIKALRGDASRRIRGPARRVRAIRWTLAAAGAAAAFATVGVVYQRSPPAYESGVGEQRIVRLADGSTLRLNTDSRVRADITADRRDVRLLRGQALFEVAHDPSRPFRVRAGGTEVRALGTVFDVRLSPREVDVVLLQGSVQVRTPSGGQRTLKPDQRIEVRDGALTAPTTTDARRDIGWAERRLTFEQTPLSAALAEVNRYSRAKVKLEASDLADAPVNGVFETGDARSFAAAAASVFDLQVVNRGSTIVLRRPEVAER